MKIFFLAQYYFDLYKPILKELEKQGHDVFLVEDILLPADPNFRELPFYVKIKRHLYRLIKNVSYKYWSNKIKTEKRYSESYDLFLCIDGISFHPFLLKHLKEINPKLKSILYLWDTNRYYKFYRYKHCFNKVCTFDPQDAASIKGISILPSYWVPTPIIPVKYALSMVGSDHDNRLEIVSNVYRQLEKNNINSFLRVVVREPSPLKSWKRKFKYFRDKYQKEIDLWNYKKTLPFVVEKKFSGEEVMQLIDESECVLDTDKPIQTGATQRVIWALARGKKVISTNVNLLKMPFYRKEQIHIIDRDNPVIDIDFITKHIDFTQSAYIQKLRIDMWVNDLISIEE